MFWRRKKEREFDEELQFHLDAEAEERAESGLSSSEARLAAQRELGNIGLVKESTREVWRWMSLERMVVSSVLCKRRLGRSEIQLCSRRSRPSRILTSRTARSRPGRAGFWRGASVPWSASTVLLLPRAHDGRLWWEHNDSSRW
jgi:hypothetical protein